MPMYFGHKAHRQHGVPMRPQRNGAQMQSDLDRRQARSSLTWGQVEDMAWRDESLRADIARMRASGSPPHEALARFAARFEQARASRESFESRRAAALAASGAQEK